MSCDCTEKISLLIDGELPTSEMREVERHLVNCAECRQLRADFLSLRSQIGAYEPSLRAVAQRRALANILSPKSKEATVRGFGLRGPALAFATLLVVGLILGLLFYQSSNRPQPGSYVAIQSASPVPSPSGEKQSPASEKNTDPKAAEPNGTAGGAEQPASKGDSDSTTPRQTPIKPVRPKVVREPKPGEQFATIPNPVQSADTQTMTAMHFEKSELLLRAFRNVRLSEPGMAAEVSYERRRAQQLVYQNMILRREADTSGDVQVATLLESLEPILLDIANLPADADDEAVEVIKARVERKNIVALLQVNSAALARALD